MTSPTRAEPEPGFRGVIFDLDGTLVDSWTLHLRCLRHAAVTTGLPEPGTPRLAAAQRPTDIETLRALVTDDRLDDAVRAYRQELRRLLAYIPASTLAAPRARETIDLLRLSGVTLGVCTGRSRADAQALIDASGIAIDLTVAREDAPRPKPAPDGLLHALALLRLAAGETLYVGDSSADSRQGESAGVTTLLLSLSRSDSHRGGTACGSVSFGDLPALLRRAGA